MSMDLNKAAKWLTSISLIILFIGVFDLSLSRGENGGSKKATTTQLLPNNVSNLTLSDCSTCHRKIVKQIESGGKSHSTKVTCVDCHKGHPPNDWDIIPQCFDCHTGKSHFEITDCLQCHTNPHTPLEITLTKDITGPCVTCHKDQDKQLRENISIHSKLDCTACHYEHGQIPDCLRCHLPHTNDSLSKECNTCHPAHKPLVVSYGPEISSAACKTCHQTMAELITASGTMHGKLECVKCHVTKHKMVPQCEMCHVQRHSQWILNKFPVCGDCHGNAHDLVKMGRDA